MSFKAWFSAMNPHNRKRYISGIIYIVSVTPFAMEWASMNYHYRLIQQHDELRQPPYGDSILRAHNWARIAVSIDDRYGPS